MLQKTEQDGGNLLPNVSRTQDGLMMMMMMMMIGELLCCSTYRAAYFSYQNCKC